VDVLEHAVEVSASVDHAESLVRMRFSREGGGPAVILLPQTGATEVTAKLDGAPLELTRMDRAQALDRLVELSAARGSPRLIAAGGLALAEARVDLGAEPHLLEIHGAPLTDWSASSPRVVQPLRHFGTACRTPAVDVTMTLSSPSPVGAVFTPFHDPQITRTDLRSVQVSLHTPANQQCHDAVLYLTSGERSVAASALTYRAPSCDPGAEAHPGFMLLAAGATPLESGEARAKDVALVIDTSGSMSGDKIESVRRALSSILGSLAPDDRFDLITFSGAASAHFGQLASARDSEAIASARRVAASLPASGSTNIHDGLITALRELGADEPDRPKAIMFLTDGQATAGVTDTNAILSAVQAMNEIRARVFSFGVGFDVNTTLLDSLSRQTGASTHYIRPGDDIDAVLAGFYREIAAPIATDLELITDGFTVRDRYPDTLPDLFVGSQLLALARYDDSPAARLAIRAKTTAGDESFDVAGAIVRSGTEHEFLPRLWASRRLGQLLYEARQNHGEEVTVDAIRELALRFGFVTRFTPFHVDEEGEVQREYDDPTAAESGREAVETSGYINDLSGNSNAAGYSAGEGSAPIRQVLDRTFIYDSGYWVDTTAPEDLAMADPIEVEYLGEDWRAMIAASPTARALLSVGTQVVLRWRCHLVRVSDPSLEGDTPSFEPVPRALLELDPNVEAMPIPARPASPANPANPGNEPEGPAKGDDLQEVAPSCATTAGSSPSVLLLLGAFALLAQRRRRKYR